MEADSLRAPDKASIPAPAPSATHHALLQRPLDAPGVCHREPDLGNGALLGDVNVAHVQDVVNGLHLLHFNGPGVPVGSCFLQEALTVRLCLCDDLDGEHTQRNKEHSCRALATWQNGSLSAIMASLALGSLLWPAALTSHQPS